MIIEPSVDISIYCDLGGHFTEAGAKAMHGEAQRSMEAIEQMRPVVNTTVCVLKGRINEKLQEKTRDAYEAIVKFVESEEYRSIISYDYEMQVFQSASMIYQMERNSERTIFDQIKYTDEFLGIFMQVYFYLRRIQLNLAKPVQLEGIQYLRTRGFSIYLLAQILVDCPVGNKDQVVLRLADFYSEMGQKEDAIFLLDVMEARTEGEEREKLLEKKALLV